MTASEAMSVSVERAGYALYALGALMVLTLPVFAAIVGRAIALDSDQIGLLAAAESAGGVIAAITAPWWIQRVNLRHLAMLSLIVMTVGAIATIFTASFESLAAVRLVTSILGGGPAYALGIAALARSPSPDRAFAVGTAIQALASAVLLFGLPLIMEKAGFVAAMLAYVIAFATGLLFCRRLPSSVADERADETASDNSEAPVNRAAYLAALIMLASAFCVAAGSQAFWVFSEQLAAGGAMESSVTGSILAAATILSVGGGMAAALLAARFERDKLFFYGTAVLLLCLGFTSLTINAANFALAVLAVSFFSVFLIPFQFAALTEFAEAESAILLMPAAQSFGAVAGPVCVGYAVLSGGLIWISGVSAIFALIGWIAFRTSISCYNIKCARPHPEAVHV